jgi:hypothetical protein
MQAREYRPWATLITCLSQHKTRAWPLPETTHHCTLELPHDEHRCACGITWHDEPAHA